MKVLAFTLALGTALAFSAQAQTLVKQTRSLARFDAVDASGGIDLVLTPGSTSAVVVEASPADQPHLQTTVSNGQLEVKWENTFGFGKSHGKARVYVTCPPLKSFELSGGSTAHTTAPLTANDLKLSVSSGSNATLALNAKQLTSNTSSGSTAKLSGRAEQQKVAVSSGSSYQAFALQTTKTDAEASSGATAEVAVTGELSATASSGGSVRYKGAPRAVKTEKSSGGSVNKAE